MGNTCTHSDHAYYYNNASINRAGLALLLHVWIVRVLVFAAPYVQPSPRTCSRAPAAPYVQPSPAMHMLARTPWQACHLNWQMADAAHAYGRRGAPRRHS